MKVHPVIRADNLVRTWLCSMRSDALLSRILPPLMRFPDIEGGRERRPRPRRSNEENVDKMEIGYLD